jgi:hypothetical protein
LIPVITHAIDSRDGVFIGGKHLHNTFKPMTNNELTLDQLQTISGGRVTRCGTVHTFLTEKVGEDNNTGAMR